MQTFFLAMVCYPEVQEKARKELDAVMGSESGRMPTFEDRDKLPYIAAIAKECLRWLPVGPMGFAHVTLEDEEYNGYFIPAGSALCPNVWCVLSLPCGPSRSSRLTNADTISGLTQGDVARRARVL